MDTKKSWRQGDIDNYIILNNRISRAKKEGYPGNEADLNQRFLIVNKYYKLDNK